MENNRTQSNPIIIRPSQLSLALDREERLGREQEERYKQRLEDFQMMTGRPTGPEDPNGDPNRRYKPDDGDTDYLLRYRYRYMKEVVAKQYKTHQQAAQHRKEPTPSPTTPSPTIGEASFYSPGNLRLIEAPKPITDQPPGPAPQQPWPLAWLATMAFAYAANNHV